MLSYRLIHLQHSGPASEDEIILIALSLLEILILVFCRDHVGLSIFTIMAGLGKINDTRCTVPLKGLKS
jgi:hypothetical protein